MLRCSEVTELVCKDRIRSLWMMILFRWRFKQHCRKRKSEWHAVTRMVKNT
jgi:hypothetical protein